jgi:DNA-binding NtrC family response regulator
MLDCTALLVSTDPLLIRAATESKHSIEHLALETCPGIAEGRARLGREDVALVLIHRTAASDQGEVTRLLSATAARDRSCSAVVLSDTYQAQEALAFLRAGAADYLRLPVPPVQLAYLLDTLTVRARLGLRARSAAAEGDGGAYAQEACNFVVAPEMADLMGQLRRVAPQETTLLFTGETGTGKTRLARLIHELSPRREEPFLVIDCGALTPTLIESEMFGHVKGAFTGAERDRPGKFSAAGGGTLLLDEINSLPPPLQGKLLRVIDERAFEPVGSNALQPLRARLVVASNRPLHREVREGRFRADLFYRLNVVELRLAPLRERRGAIAPLANRFLAEFAARSGRSFCGIAPDALRALQEHAWPGNIRELRNVLERAVALCPGGEVQLRDLPEIFRAAHAPPGPPATALRLAVLRAPGAGRSALATVKQEAEVVRITEALRRHRNNRLRAAAELGISRMALYKKLHKYGLMGAS